MDTVVFERDGHVYLVAPVAPLTLDSQGEEEIAFAADVRAMAPNENILWLRGQYVEADKPNRNGQMWTAGDLEIASLTPNLMPVTVMHDPRSAVGLIADTKMLTVAADGVPRSRIETTLAVWQHRFPDIAQEVAANYRQGQLMQSMECLPAWDECLECGRRFPRLPDRAEVASWCEHFNAKKIGAALTTAARRLGQVSFTGSGLIFGTRGAIGAFDEAHLESLQDDVAEFHERAHEDRKPAPRRPRHMEISDQDYQDLVAAKSERDSLKARIPDLEEKANKVPDLEQKLEAEETAHTATKTERDDLKTKVDQAEETARAESLKGDRWGKLGKDFLAKLGDFTRGRLEEQAKTLSEEEWDNRLKEIEESASVQRDAGGQPDPAKDDTNDGTVTKDDTARAHLGGSGSGSGSGSGGGGSNGEPSDAERRSLVGNLVKRTK